MAALSLIFARIAKKLPSVYTFDIGADEISKLSSPPRIVAVPMNEIITAPRGQGGDSTPKHRPLRTRVVTVGFRIWGVDMDQVEEMLNELANVINDDVWGSWQFTGGEWLHEGITADGYQYILGVTFDIPITRRTPKTAIATQAPITADMDTENIIT